MHEQRKSRRFDLHLPFELVKAGSEAQCENSETCNLSSNGVLFKTETPMQLGESLEYLITLPSINGSLRIRCFGKVARFGQAAVAATLEKYEFIRRQ